MSVETSDVVLPPPAFALSPVAWSDRQLERLRGEWLTALRAFAYHLFITLCAVRGDPPSQYRVDFRVRSLVIDESEQLQYVDSVPVEIWIPPGYPSQAPLVRPLALDRMELAKAPLPYEKLEQLTMEVIMGVR